MSSDYESPRRPLPTDRCRHILCKGMFVYGAGYESPVEEDDRTNDFWCQKTQRVMGPDGKLVMLSQCAAGRQCFEAL